MPFTRTEGLANGLTPADLRSHRFRMLHRVATALRSRGVSINRAKVRLAQG
jgi:hypothetical protein